MFHQAGIAEVSPRTAASSEQASLGPVVTRPVYLLVIALVIGFAVEALLHGGGFGLGYALAALVVVAGWLVLARGLGIRPSLSALFLLTCFVALSLCVALRTSLTLRAFDVLLGLGLLLMAAVVCLPGGITRLSISEYATGLFLSALGALIQPFVYLLADVPTVQRSRAASPPRRLAPVAWGILLAIPILATFGALFASADLVFASYLRQIFDWNIDIGELVLRTLLSLALTWLAIGLARYAFAARRVWDIKLARPAHLQLGQIQVVTVLALLNALFAVFVLVQAAYLFAGLDTLARTGLTHSQYARSGFFELVFVAALVVSLVLVLDWLTAPRSGPTRRWIDGLHALLIGFTLVILVSAVYRMQLYVAEYGLTELRFYTTVFMAWLALILLLLAAILMLGPTQPRPEGRADREPGKRPGPDAGKSRWQWKNPFSGSLYRRRFAFAALVLGLAIWLGTNLVNPDAVIARANLARVAAHPEVTRPCQPGATDGGVERQARPGCLDVSYLVRLSSDATPTLIAGLDRIPDPCSRAWLAGELKAKADRLEAQLRSRSWRTYTWGELRGREGLAAADAALVRFAAVCPSP